METPSKLRVVFDRNVLNKHQRLEGLTRSWVLLRPNMKTISDLQSRVQKRFCLDKKCPNGVVLYIDGFVLPPFESTCLLHESDIISVRKKDNTQINSTEIGDKPLAITKAGDGPNGIQRDSRLNSKKRKHSDEVSRSKKKKRKVNSKKLITQEEDEDIIDNVVDHQIRKKSSNCSSEDHKLTCSLQREKQLKKDSTLIDSIEVGDKPLAIIETGENSNAQKRKTGKVPYMHNENGFHTDSQLGSKKREHFETLNPNILVLNSAVCGSTHNHTNGSMAEKQSRSARRKKEKKMSIRKLKEQNRQFGVNDKLLTQQEIKQNAAVEKKTASPASSGWPWQAQEIQAPDNWNRPANKNKQNNESANQWHQSTAHSNHQYRPWQAQEIQAPDNWNRPANKNKQNNESVNQWHQSTAHSNHQYCNRNQENRSNWSDHTNNSNQYNARNNSNKWNNANGHNGKKWNWTNRNHKGTCNETTTKWNDVVSNKEQCKGKTSKWDDAGNNYDQSIRNELVLSNEKKGSNPADFENLFPLTRIPQVGDVVAYRLIEISPTWCPSVTPFRIGEVTSYNYLTLSIVLVPVPEYPISTSDTQQQSSLYKEDGTLQTHYPSLIDVRLFKAFDSFKASSDSLGSIENGKNPQKENSAPVYKWDLVLANGGSNVNEIAAPPMENGNGRGGSTWDQIKHMINEKRSEIDESKKDGWGEWSSNKSTPSKSSWQNGGCLEWNKRGRNPQQAARGRGRGKGKL